MAPASAGALDISIAHVPHGWRDRLHAWIHGGDDGLQTHAPLVFVAPANGRPVHSVGTSDEHAGTAVSGPGGSVVYVERSYAFEDTVLTHAM